MIGVNDRISGGNCLKLSIHRDWQQEQARSILIHCHLVRRSFLTQPSRKMESGLNQRCLLLLWERVGVRAGLGAQTNSAA